MSASRAVETWGSRLRPNQALAVLGVLLAVCWLGIGRDLWTPDEPREAEISREMWLAPSVVPSLNDQVFIEKPPLYYWTVAGVFELVGGASAWAARSVSAVASFLTLALVFFWGRREFSAGVGLLAAVGLASSAQFLISSHWVLIDPLLMLFTTVAAWGAWQLLARDGGWRATLMLYGGLVLALWTKGLIGPVLFACGFFVHALWTRRRDAILRLRPFTGIAALLGATAVLAALVFHAAGYEAVREWLWVNHVMRFVNPQNTGHDQPFYYYLVNVPTAVLPWWVPFADIFRPRRWVDAAIPNMPLRKYLASMCIGMALILSASSTKRSIYLLPMLPLLALLLAVHGAAWLERARGAAVSHWPWWTQVGLVVAFAIAPPFVGMAYVRQLDPLAATLVAVFAVLAGAVFLFRGDKAGRGVIALGANAIAGLVGLFVVALHFGGPAKNMSEFVTWLDAQLPKGESVYGYGTLDETFDGIVPFVTGRKVVPLEPADIDRLAPTHVVVQNKDGGSTAPDLSSEYDLLRERNFGPGRYFAIWRRKPESPTSVRHENTKE